MSHQLNAHDRAKSWDNWEYWCGFSTLQNQYSKLTRNEMSRFYVLSSNTQTHWHKKTHIFEVASRTNCNFNQAGYANDSQNFAQRAYSRRRTVNLVFLLPLWMAKTRAQSHSRDTNRLHERERNVEYAREWRKNSLSCSLEALTCVVANFADAGRWMENVQWKKMNKCKTEKIYYSVHKWRYQYN